MMRVLYATFLTVLFHAVLAAGLGALLEFSPSPPCPALLDLSSIELSVGERDIPAPPCIALPAAPPIAASARPRQLSRPEILSDRSGVPYAPRPPQADCRQISLPDPPPPAPEVFEEDVDDREQEQPKPAAVSAPAMPAQEAPRQARIDAPARLQRQLRPEYPEGARRRGEEGAVILSIFVSARGRAEAVEVVGSSGFPELDAAASAAVRKARLTPATSGGKAVASHVRLTVRFRLKE